MKALDFWFKILYYSTIKPTLNSSLSTMLARTVANHCWLSAETFYLIKIPILILFTGVMLIYLSCIQIFINMWIYLLPYSNAATVFSSLLLVAAFLPAGYLLHYKDFTMYTSWLEYVSPTSWLLPYLLNRELTQEAIESSSTVKLCRSKQVSKIWC